MLTIHLINTWHCKGAYAHAQPDMTLDITVSRLTVDALKICFQTVVKFTLRIGIISAIPLDAVPKCPPPPPSG